jgi:hypothetical protein
MATFYNINKLAKEEKQYVQGGQSALKTGVASSTP